jgi:outer membrane lipoprotein-sorting protein
MPRFPRFLIAAIFAGALIARVSADPDTIIAKARAYLGPEAALNAITSIHYVGTFESEETVKDDSGKTVTRPFKGSIEFIFDKPYRQRMVMISYKGTEITALDDYEAWYCLQEPGGSSIKSLTLFGRNEIKSLRVITWENFAYFRGIERRGGHVEDLGAVTIDGRSCEKLAFVHEPGIVYYRYFDTATGQLLLTELENGNRIRQEGEVMVNGVRFPKKLIQTTKDSATGKETTVIIAVDKVTLNETFPESLFAVPMLSVK